MTQDDKRWLAVIRKGCGLYREDECGESSEIGVALFLLRLLDEAIAERDAAMARCQRSAEEYAHLASRSLAREDAAMAALRVASDALRSYAFGNSAPDLAKEVAEHCDRVLAAHSAATKQADPVEKAVSDG